jgi:hypothetical protein
MSKKKQTSKSNVHILFLRRKEGRKNDGEDEKSNLINLRFELDKYMEREEMLEFILMMKGTV